MGIKKQKQKPIPLVLQLTNLKRSFDTSILSQAFIKNSELICLINLKPSEESDTYVVKITCKYGKKPRAWLISPDMQQVHGKYPHHLFGVNKDGKRELCVCAPDYQEWNNNLWISESFVPWICTWLNAYEFWLITGKWHYDEYTKNKSVVKK